VYDFSLGNPDLEPPESFRATMATLVADPATGRHGYMPNAGYPEVRKAVARRASAEQGIELGAGNILMTVGAAGALNVVLKAILDPGDEVLVIRPFFSEYALYAQNHGGRTVIADSGPGFSLSADSVRAALSPRTACVIINSPNNPTGVIYSAEELRALAAVLLEHGRKTGRYPYLVADEPYRGLVYGGAKVPSAMAAYPETIVASSWSKSLSLPGERIGYIAISPRCADAAELFEGMAFCIRVLGFVNAPALMQRAVARLLDERVAIETYARRGRLLADGLCAAGYEFPEPAGAFYIFARVPSRVALAPTAQPESDPTKVEPSSPPTAQPLAPDKAFVQHLKRYGILAVPGSGYSYPGWFRLAYCVSERTIEAAIPQFRRAMEDWRAGR